VLDDVVEVAEGTDDGTRIFSEDAASLEVLADNDGSVVMLFVGMDWVMVAVTVDVEAAPFAEVETGRKPQPTTIRIARKSGMTIASDHNFFTVPASFRMMICPL
jgi:hypothetical protein